MLSFTAEINRYLDHPDFYSIDEIADLMNVDRSHIEVVVAERWQKLAYEIEAAGGELRLTSVPETSET